MKSDIHFDAIKIMLLTTTQGTVCTKPLRMCSFPTQLKLFSFKLATLIKLYKLLKNSRCIKVAPTQLFADQVILTNIQIAFCQSSLDVEH